MNATSTAALYTGRCTTAWTGDRFGHEWNLGWSVYANQITDDDQKAFVVYEDDGKGNGNYHGDYDTLELAIQIVNKLVADADGRHA